MHNSGRINFLLTALVLASSIAMRAGTLIDVAFTSAAVTGKTGFAATGVSTNDFWNTDNDGPLTDLKFADGANSSAGLTVQVPYPFEPGFGRNGASDPMYGTYLSDYDRIIDIKITNLESATYDIYVYGHGSDDGDDGVYQVSVSDLSSGIATTTNGAGWLSPVWQEGVQYVEFTNVSILTGQTLDVFSSPGLNDYAVIAGLQLVSNDPPSPSAVILRQPSSQIVKPGSVASLNVMGGGASPLGYQWLFNSAVLPGATNNSYTIPSAQLSDAGNYSVIVSNAYGAVTSAVVTLTLYEPFGRLIDVAFTGAAVTAKTGSAATGVTSDDFWNTYSVTNNLDNPDSFFGRYGYLQNMKFSDGTVSPAGLNTVIWDYPVAGNNGASDAMYGQFLYPSFYGDMSFTVTNLAPGTYDFYLYGHGPADNINSVFHLTSGSVDYGIEGTVTNREWRLPYWEEGFQYVQFSGVAIPSGQNVNVDVEPGGYAYPVLSGVQMLYVGPLVAAAPEPQSIIQGFDANFSVVAAGAPPLSYQWGLNGTNIPFATNAALTITNVQPASVGDYSVIVADSFGSVTSSVVSLTLSPPKVSSVVRNADGSATLSLMAPPNSTAQLWAATNLSFPIIWRLVSSNDNIGPSGVWAYTDTNAARQPETFFRFSISTAP